MSINNLKFGDLVLLDFPFADSNKSKRRPALVIREFEDGDAIVSRITTKIYKFKFDIKISKSKENGLLADSVIRVHKIATISQSLITQKIGKISKASLNQIKERLNKLV